MKKKIILTALLGCALTAGAQKEGFVVNGRVAMPDGTEVGLSCTTDTSFSVELAHGTVKNGRFKLKGRVDRPYVGMLTTNNLRLVEKHKWPTDSIKWTYTDVYVGNDTYNVSPDLTVTGGSVQADFAELQRMGGARGDSVWAFIDRRPQSPVAVWLANTLLQRAYNLTDAQVAHLAQTLQPNTIDPEGFRQYQTRLAAARRTTIGSPLASLELKTTDGRTLQLTDAVPHNGKYTLLDFWASWCGICLYAMPEVKTLSERHADSLNVLGISIDTKDEAWRKAMEKHPEPWPQYCTTAAGYRDLTDKLQIGNGVPYYLLVAPDGRVVGSPNSPADAERMLLERQGRYCITGTADSTADGDSVFICSMQGFFSMVPEDTAVVRGGEFCFMGNTEGARLRYIVPIHQGEAKGMASFILEPGRARMQVYADNTRNMVEGGPNQQLWDAFEREDSTLSARQNDPWAIMQDSTQDEAARRQAQAQLDSLQAQQRLFHRQYIVDHMPSALSDMLYGFYQGDMTTDEQEALLKLMGDRQPQYPVYKELMAARAATAATAVGQPYTDIAMGGTDGRTVKVSDYVGRNRYTLIDFWASWCGPCRAEMPNVAKAYAKYHKKGFEVVGVSLDNNRAAWLKAIKQLRMPWPQMSDLKGWESAGAAAYNVRAIPANVLVDSEGRIVAKDLREEALQEKLAELFNK